MQNKWQTALMPIADGVAASVMTATDRSGGVAVLQGGDVETARRPSAPAWHNRMYRYSVSPLCANWGIAARGFIFE